MTGNSGFEGAHHGGGISRAAAHFGGAIAQWLDLSTGINSQAYPVGIGDPRAWRALPDDDAQQALEHAARAHWGVPESAAVIAAPGASALIARLPALAQPGLVDIPGPTYSEHARAFRAHGWRVESAAGGEVAARVLVNPNNPDGRTWTEGSAEGAGLLIIDESFCDTVPSATLIRLAARPGTVVLKSFGKFWGLAGLRLGFAVGDPRHIARIGTILGPWPVSGPALAIGARALADGGWAEATRERLARDAARLDALLAGTGARVEGGTTLFRLYRTAKAAALYRQLGQAHILARIFEYEPDWIRLGLPGTEAEWRRLEAAL